MLKFFICLMVIAAGSGTGWWIGGRYRARVRQLEACDQFLSRMQSCLTAEHLTTRELFERAAESGSLLELSFLRWTAEALETDMNFPLVWRESLQKSRDELAMTEDDYAPLEALAEVVGASDANTQARALELTRGLLRENLAAAREQSRVNGKLSNSLGFFGGVAVAILLL